ncbi:MAG: hydrogenase, partial [bacterium]|nr:hydrogenase [bacterium]
MASVSSVLKRPLIEGDKTPAQVTKDICAVLDRKPTMAWWVAFLVSFTVMAVGFAAISYQIATGIGTW